MDNTEKFSGKADVYERFRPSYPQALYDFISRRFLPERDGTVIDTGSVRENSHCRSRRFAAD